MSSIAHASRLPAAVLATTVCCTPAWAEVYRCTVDGVVQYSDRPCGAADAPLDVPAPNVMQAEPVAKAVSTDRGADYRKARAEEDAQWRADYEARQASEQRIREARARGELVEGMTAADVRRKYGEPLRKTTSTTKKGRRETWHYEVAGTGRVTVTLQDGVVAQVHEGKDKKKR